MSDRFYSCEDRTAGCRAHLGVGWLAEEMEVLGHAFAGRGARSDEMIEIMRRLWRDGSAEYHGRYFDFERVHAEPKPDHPIPLYVGGHTEAAIRRAARCDGWMGLDFAVDEIPVVIDRLRRARKEAGNASSSFEIILSPRGRAGPSRAASSIAASRTWASPASSCRPGA